MMSGQVLRRRTYLPWVCWGPGGWQIPHPHTPIAAAPGKLSDLGGGRSRGGKGYVGNLHRHSWALTREQEMEGTRHLAPGAAWTAGHTCGHRPLRLQTAMREEVAHPKKRGGVHRPCPVTEWRGPPPERPGRDLGGARATQHGGSSTVWKAMGPDEHLLGQQLRTELQSWSGRAGRQARAGQAARPPNHCIFNGVTVVT